MFDSVILAALTPEVSGAVLGTLVVYRVVYYLLLAVASLMLAGHELSLHRGQVAAVAGRRRQVG